MILRYGDNMGKCVGLRRSRPKFVFLIMKRVSRDKDKEPRPEVLIVTFRPNNTNREENMQ